MRQTLLWGGLSTLALLVILPFLPDSFPNFAIPLAYLLVARLVAERFQMSKRAIAASGQYGFQSNWNVAGVTVVGLIVVLSIAVAWFFVLYAYGIINSG